MVNGKLGGGGSDDDYGSDWVGGMPKSEDRQTRAAGLLKVTKKRTAAKGTYM